MNCRGCGVILDPSEGQVNTAVDQILETSLQDAEMGVGAVLSSRMEKFPQGTFPAAGAGFAATRLLTSLLYGIRPSDPFTLTLVALFCRLSLP
jgi:hypothetical protein